METLTTSEAADLLGMNVQKFFRVAAAAELTPALEAPGLRGAKFWHRSDVEQLAKANDESQVYRDCVLAAHRIIAKLTIAATKQFDEDAASLRVLTASEMVDAEANAEQIPLGHLIPATAGQSETPSDPGTPAVAAPQRKEAR